MDVSCEMVFLKPVLAGVGCDAKVALEIHNLREENPEKFYNQVCMCVSRFSYKMFTEA